MSMQVINCVWAQYYSGLNERSYNQIYCLYTSRKTDTSQHNEEQSVAVNSSALLFIVLTSISFSVSIQAINLISSPG